MTTQTSPRTFAEAEAVLAQSLPGYESRPQQRTLATFVEDVFSQKIGVGLAEAGTGCGKSLGTLIPAILSGKRTVVATATLALMQQYCLSPETRVLTADLRYVPIGDVREGDDLVGFDEERVGHRRRFRTATVMSSERIMRPSYRLTFEDGTSLVSSEDHRWLVRKGGEVKWVTTKNLSSGAGSRPGSAIVRLFDTWETGSSRQHGYLAAAFDGEGHLSQIRSSQLSGGYQNQLSFAQKPNPMLASVESSLSSLGFKSKTYTHSDVCRVSILGRANIVRFLGEVRPDRLLPKFTPDMLGTIPVQDRSRIVAKEFLGEVEVVAVKTSTGTFVAEGLASHNCSKDVPFLQEHLGVDFNWALLKGRSNYFCYAKAAEKGLVNQPGTYAKLMEELDADPDHGGSMDDFETTVEKSQWGDFSISSADCPGRSKCPFGETCLAEKAKAKARAADLVITNTAMLMTDVKIRRATSGAGEMIGQWDLLAIDEAHELEEIATSQLEETMRQSGMKVLADDALVFLMAYGDDRDLTETTSRLEAASQDAWSLLPAPEKGERQQRIGLSFFAEHFEEFLAVVEALRLVLDAVTSVTVSNDKQAQVARQRITTRIVNMISRYEELLTADDTKIVRWVEWEESSRHGKVKALHFAPIHVGSILKEYLWSVAPSVLVSATMSTDGDFSYIKERLSAEDARTVNVGTPFDYDSQALLFVPDRNVASPKNRTGWMTYSQIATTELIESSGGGALLLFTSRSAMQASYEALVDRIETKGHTVLMQGLSGSNKAIVARFKEDGHAVLFALKSFFTGVDIPGDALRLVVIDKLPFPVPSEPVFQARADEIKRKGGSDFSRLSMPMMTLTLNQAYGRLIRTKSDRGVVAILDSRLSSTGWGNKIVRSLPDSPATTRLADVKSFYEKG